MFFYGALFLILILDQATKYIIVQKIALHNFVDLISGFLSLSLVNNDRGAFGFLILDKKVFISVSLLLIITFIWYYHHMIIRKAANIFLSLSIGMVTGGALGNFIDRIRYGYVIDFIDLHIGTVFQWPVFNIADIGITIGLIMISLKTLIEKQDDKKSANLNV